MAVSNRNLQTSRGLFSGATLVSGRVIGSLEGEFLQSHGPSERVKICRVFLTYQKTPGFCEWLDGIESMNKSPSHCSVMVKIYPPTGMFGLPWDKWVGKKDVEKLTPPRYQT